MPLSLSILYIYTHIYINIIYYILYYIYIIFIIYYICILYMYTPYVGEMNLHQSSIKFLHQESKLAEPPVGIQACENGDIL